MGNGPRPSARDLRSSDIARLLLPVVAGVVLLFRSLSAAEADPEPWMIDRYEVEIIVFRHLDQARNTPEQPAAAPILGASPLDLYPEPEPIPFLGPYADPSTRENSADDRSRKPAVDFYLLDLKPEFPDFVPLDDADRQLNQLYARLERLDIYAPLLHRAWVQPARSPEEAVPFQIADIFDEFSLEGRITLYRRRYTHLEIDLDLAPTPPDEPDAGPERPAWPTFGDVFTPPDEGIVVLQAPVTPAYKLQESRRIRGRNAQYFDHPQFGVIARITELELTGEPE
ncbi:MAG: CsiV family protein [Gammaproteobacteria bacterium]